MPRPPWLDIHKPSAAKDGFGSSPLRQERSDAGSQFALLISSPFESQMCFFFGGGLVVVEMEFEEKQHEFSSLQSWSVSDIPRPDVTHRGDWAILFIWHLKRSMLRQRCQRSKWSHWRTEANFGSCIGLGIRTWTCHWERTTWSFMNIVT